MMRRIPGIVLSLLGVIGLFWWHDTMQLSADGTDRSMWQHYLPYGFYAIFLLLGLYQLIRSRVTDPC